MNPSKKTAFLGMAWAGLDKKGLQKLLDVSLENFKPAWKVAANTEVVVSHDPADLEQARARGIEAMDPRAWMGMSEVPGSTSVFAYLQGLLDAGFRIHEHTTEGDSAAVVARLPITPRAVPVHTSAEHFARKREWESEMAAAAADEIVGWVRVTFADWFRPHPSVAARPHGFLPCSESGEGIWVTGFEQTITATRADAVVLAPAILARIDELRSPDASIANLKFYETGSLGAVRSLYVLAAIEGGGRHVSLVALPIVNT